MKISPKWRWSIIGLLAAGCIVLRPPPPEPIPPPEVVQEGFTIEDTPIMFELLVNTVITALPDNGTLTVEGRDLQPEDLPYLIQGDPP